MIKEWQECIFNYWKIDAFQPEIRAQAQPFSPGILLQLLLGGALLYVFAQGHIVTYCVRSCVPNRSWRGVRPTSGAHSWSGNSERQMPPGIFCWVSPQRLPGRSAGRALPSLSPPCAGTIRHLRCARRQKEIWALCGVDTAL